MEIHPSDVLKSLGDVPAAVSKHCIYPALVGCSAPVEAVLPQISNMWSRGFGQLVRARNIKTVGDLSALTPAEVKTLPIRSPKISNVKKALQTYEQQRKGRGGDELKSFDETERMTSEVEETSAPQTADEDDKTTGETLATELPDEVVAEPQEARGLPEVPEAPLLSELQALCCRASPAALGRCSPRELVDAHQLLGGLMSSVVRELESRVGRAEGAGPVP
ncbi:telomere-associated protein RIF1-like [Salarias fasciatus]|uniref:telomere-associated protein RIF1-like n=1 Tax=Salarias fasciatus TaxID=181472 RepID=UPI00117700BE|nr:telomere-associated protein RIF1-like [Salarias fasciatus]